MITGLADCVLATARRYVVVTGKFFITQIGAPYKARIIALIDCFLQRRWALHDGNYEHGTGLRITAPQAAQYFILMMVWLTSFPSQ